MILADNKKILALDDGTFPALLKTLSDPSEAVITRDLQLLSQISYNSADDYFASFMENLLTLFSTDRRLLETRGNLIIRQLCTSLNPERIYRTLAEILEKEEDIEFASTMVQILNNNLITAPELADLRRRLRSLESKVASFRPRYWCFFRTDWFCRKDKLSLLPCFDHGVTTPSLHFHYVY